MMSWQNSIKKCVSGLVLICATVAVTQRPLVGQSLSRLVSDASDPGVFESLEGDLRMVPEGRDNATALRADGRFSGRINLKSRNIEPREFDLIKIDVRADGRSTLQISLENYPKPGLLSHWYLYCKSRDAFDWETAWMDLRRPEEIKEAGAYKGLDEADPSLRGLRIAGFVSDSHRKIQPPGRRTWIGPIRFVKKAVHLDWDQREAPFTSNRREGLAFRYALRVTNRLREPITATLELVPIDVTHATGKLAADAVDLGPGETKVVEATIGLPAAVAAKSPPLYCERFLALAEAEGQDDSQVTILRSSDPVPLTVTVPVPDNKLRFPLLPRRNDLPETVTGFQERHRGTAVQLAEAVRPRDLQDSVGNELEISRGVGLYAWGDNEPGQRYIGGLTAAAFLYDFTREAQYLDKGIALLRAAADHFPRMKDKWEREEVTTISHGLFAVNTLRLGWSTGGMRPPYLYQRHGMFNDFDLLAANMKPQDRQQIIDEFILPAAIHMRNHTFGLGNQQDVVNYAILYGGLAARNWPLVSFAYSSDYGLLNEIKWDFDDDGLAGEGHYHTPALRPVLYATELLHQVGVDLYDDRLYLITHSPAADAIGKPFRDSIRGYIDEHRFKGKAVGGVARKADGVHLSTGVTSLRWKELEVSMNWGKQIHRGAPDRCSFRVNAPERNPLHRIGGGNYSHSSLGQSIIIVDEGLQNPMPAKVIAHDVEGPVQFVQTRSDEHYPGSTITRTFALVDETVLAIDRVESNEPRTVDWCLRYAGGNQTEKDVADAVDLPLKHRTGSFTNKPGDSAHGVNFGRDLKSMGYYVADTEKTWRQAKGEMSMAGERGTEVMVFAVRAAFSASVKERKTGVPVLMVRRKNAKRTDFIAVFSPDVRQLEQLALRKANGGTANAVGVRITRTDGMSFNAIVNYEAKGTPVQLGKLKTSQPFAVD